MPVQCPSATLGVHRAPRLLGVQHLTPRTPHPGVLSRHHPKLPRPLIPLTRGTGPGRAGCPLHLRFTIEMRARDGAGRRSPRLRLGPLAHPLGWGQPPMQNPSFTFPPCPPAASRSAPRGGPVGDPVAFGASPRPVTNTRAATLPCPAPGLGPSAFVPKLSPGERARGSSCPPLVLSAPSTALTLAREGQGGKRKAWERFPWGFLL